MRKEASLPVRLDAKVKQRLKKAADTLGMTPSALIRLLVQSFVEEYDRKGGRIDLPPRWQPRAESETAWSERDSEPAKTAESKKAYLTRV